AVVALRNASTLRTMKAPVAKVADAVKATQGSSTSTPPVPMFVAFSAVGTQVDAHWQLPPRKGGALPANIVFWVYERSTGAIDADVIAEITQPDDEVHTARFSRKSSTISLLELCAVNGAGQSCTPYSSVSSSTTPP